MTQRVLAQRSRVRRDELLDELIALFLAEGFSAFNIGELAARTRCSKSTLYLVAASKEQIVLAAVRTFFKNAAARIESRLAVAVDPVDRLRVYLDAVAAELQPGSTAFFSDLARFAPAGEIYAENTQFAARRVQELVREGVAAGRLRPVDATFVGSAVAQIMMAVQKGAIGAGTGMDDAEAYRQLADLVMHSLVPRPVG